MSGGGALESFAQDVRFAARMLVKDRAFTFVAVVALALGIGANTALFTVLSNVLLRPLPYAEPHRIMSVSTPESSKPGQPFPVSYPDFRDLRAQNTVFERLAAFRSGSFLVRSDDGEAAQVQGAWVTADMFPLLGAKPAVGRNFRPTEDEPGQPVAVISHAMWEERFGKAANVTKAMLTINGREFKIVGVMPPPFRFPVQNRAAQFWITFATELEPSPHRFIEPSRRDTHFLRVLGRLKPGASQADAEIDLQRIMTELAARYPETNRSHGASLVLPWLEEMTRNVRPLLLMLVAASASVLCLACANVANLLLARASTRRKEIALRAALGAGRRRILRQLLTESLLLATIGGVAGVVLAFAGTRYIVSALPSDFPRAAEITPDLRVLAFAGAVTLLATCLFGLAPGWRSARARLGPLLNDGGNGTGETPGGQRARGALVVAEMVLAFLLLGGACFFISNLLRLQSAPLGFNPQHLVTANFTLPPDGDETESQPATAFMDRLFERIADSGLAEAATIVSRLPHSEVRAVADIRIPGRPVRAAERPLGEAHVVVPGYFGTMQIPINRGRDFDQRDSGDATPVVIVNETLAQRFFPGENPIGKRISPGLFLGPAGRIAREIIGVAGDVRTDMLAAGQQPQFYLPWTQCRLRDLTLVVRSHFFARGVTRRAQPHVTDLDPNLATHGGATMEARVAGGVATPRLNSALLADFRRRGCRPHGHRRLWRDGFSVAQRRHEIGIRLAMGAQKGAVFRLLLSGGLRLIVWSLVLGAVCTALARPCSRLSRIEGRPTRWQ